jgi:hypothetical protein
MSFTLLSQSPTESDSPAGSAVRVRMRWTVQYRPDDQVLLDEARQEPAILARIVVLVCR